MRKLFTSAHKTIWLWTLSVTLIIIPALNVLSQDDLKLYVFIAEECPISIYMAKPLQRVMMEYGDRMELNCVFPASNSTAQTANHFLSEHDLNLFESILDPRQTLTRALGATITPEVVIVNQDDKVLYRGRINDAYFAPGKMRHRTIKYDLMIAIDRILNDRGAPQPWPEAIGCYITFKSVASQ